MPVKFAVYKGLQKPLVFKGFQGKFIYWGLASLLSGLILGALVMSMVSMWLGAFVLVVCILVGLLFTAHKQKGGLHAKRRDSRIYILTHYGRKKLV
jgi:fumarate reductase subunit D